MASFETIEYDVLIIGAGGAGLRAAIEAATGDLKVGLVCKSLLGKAHTVMAEGGVAAALANVDERDSWRVHFADTMRGGQYLSNSRMAELHAQEAQTESVNLKHGVRFLIAQKKVVSYNETLADISIHGLLTSVTELV